MVAGAQILPPSSEDRFPTAGGRPQMQLVTIYGWLLAHKELLRHLTGFVLVLLGVHIHTSSSLGNLVGETV